MTNLTLDARGIILKWRLAIQRLIAVQTKGTPKICYCSRCSKLMDRSCRCHPSGKLFVSLGASRGPHFEVSLKAQLLSQLNSKTKIFKKRSYFDGDGENDFGDLAISMLLQTLFYPKTALRRFGVRIVCTEGSPDVRLISSNSPSLSTPSVHLRLSDSVSNCVPSQVVRSHGCADFKALCACMCVSRQKHHFKILVLTKLTCLSADLI